MTTTTQSVLSSPRSCSISHTHRLTLLNPRNKDVGYAQPQQDSLVVPANVRRLISCTFNVASVMSVMGALLVQWCSDRDIMAAPLG